MDVSMTVNGEQVTHDVEPRLLLVHFMRETLGLTGTHWGCDTSNCGACVVLMDGAAGEVVHGRSRRCATGTRSAPSSRSRSTAQLDPVQQGFHELHALQCGFCTPGMLMTSARPAGREPEPDRPRDPDGDLRRHLPLHRLQEHRQRRALGRRARSRGEEGGLSMATIENLPSPRPSARSASAG